MKMNVHTEETTAHHHNIGTQIRTGKVAGTGIREQRVIEMMSNDGQTISSLKWDEMPEVVEIEKVLGITKM